MTAAAALERQIQCVPGGNEEPHPADHLEEPFAPVERPSTVPTTRQNSFQEEGSSPTNTNPSTLARDSNSPRVRTPLPNGKPDSNDQRTSDPPKESTEVPVIPDVTGRSNNQKTSNSQQNITQGVTHVGTSMEEIAQSNDPTSQSQSEVPPVGTVLEGISQSDIASQTSSTLRQMPKRNRIPKKHFDEINPEPLNSSVPSAASKRKPSATNKAPKAKSKAGEVKSRFSSNAAKRAKLEGDVPLEENEEIQKAIKEAESSNAGPLDCDEDALQAADILMSLSEECTMEQLRVHGPEAAMTLTNLRVYMPIGDNMAKEKAIANKNRAEQEAAIRSKMAQQEASTGMSLPNTQSRSWREGRKTNGVTGKEGGNRRKQATKGKGKSATQTIEDDASLDISDCDTVARASDDEEHNFPIESASCDENDEFDDPSTSSQPKTLQISVPKAKAGSSRGQRVSRSS